MSDTERLLQPISPDKPGGSDLRYVLYDTIKEARRQEDPRTIDQSVREAKTADFKQVIKLGEQALAKSSKDLWIAVWLAEAWISEKRLPGLLSSFELLQGLLDGFWDHLYPEIEDDDVENRATPIEWFGSYYDPARGSSPVLALRSVPLTVDGHHWFDYQESRKVGYEAEATSEARRKTRADAIQEGKLIPEDFDKEVEKTGKLFYRSLEQDLEKAREDLARLDTLCGEKFGRGGPSFNPLRKAIEEVGNVVHILLLKKLEKDPDPIAASETVAGAVDGETTEGEAAAFAMPSTGQLDLSKFEGGEINSSEQAVLHAVVAAQFLRRQSPGSPVPYMLLRALRWGEVRAAGSLGSADLPAPPAEVRMTLRAASAGNNWRQVLEVAEAAMSNAIGRGWLDLQRYAIKACDELGYEAAAKALRSELRCYLTDFPELPRATLNDDTGAANPETLAWLQQEGLAG